MKTTLFCVTPFLIGLIGAASQVIKGELLEAATTSGNANNLIGAEPTGYFEHDSLHTRFTNGYTFDEYVLYGLRSLALVAGYDNDLHRYDNPRDLINSFRRNMTYDNIDTYTSLLMAASRGGYGPDHHTRHHDKPTTKASSVVRIDSSEFELLRDTSDELLVLENQLNQEECARQLDLLYQHSLVLFRDHESFTGSRQLDLIELIDSFGSAPGERLMKGNAAWLGAHEQCEASHVRLSVEVGASSVSASSVNIKGRYCVASFRLPEWSRAKDLQRKHLSGDSLKLGVCLPSACNSISALRHSNAIEALVKLVRLQQAPYSSANLVRLFCLPDESSPLRQLSTSARLFVGFVCVWLALVAYFSVQFELLEMRNQVMHEKEQPGECELQVATSARCKRTEVTKLMQVFALRYAWRTLFGTAETRRPTPPPPQPAPRLLMNAKTSLSKGQIVFINSLSQQMQPPSAPQTTTSTTNNNLAAIDGIKVISMIWLISAHTMLFFMRNIANGRDFWAILRDGRFMTIMAGIFPVDSFFTVTGVLTSYLKFVKPSSRQALARPAYWLELFVHRYLRFMPMYLLIFWYTRDVSEYIGSGPLWDYATASTSLRAICKQESVRVPLLFQANFKPIQEHCVKPAWYLANDYQYLLIAPLFMVLLSTSKWLGYAALAASICASLCAQFVTVYFANNAKHDQFTDFEGLLNFKPMFAAYVLKDLWRLYVLPYNRVAPYLIGLATGHLMYAHSKRRAQKRRHQAAAAAAAPTTVSEHAQQLQSRQSRKCCTQDHDTCGASYSSSSSVASLASSGVGSETSQVSSTEATAAATNASTHLSSSQHTFDATSSSSSDSNKSILIVPSATSRLSSSKLRCTTTKPTQADATTLLSLARRYINTSVWAPLVLLLAIVYLPLVTKFIPREHQQTGQIARIGASLLIALMRFVWSLAIGRLIFVCHKVAVATSERKRLAATNFVVALLASTKWKAWSRIGLSVLLVQWEVIGYMAQMQATAPYMSISFLLSICLICIVGSYALGLAIYLIFEFPLSQIEHLFIHPKLFTPKQETKISASSSSGAAAAGHLASLPTGSLQKCTHDIKSTF